MYFKQRISLPDQLVIRYTPKGKSDPVYLSYKKRENQCYQIVKYTENLSFLAKSSVWLQNLLNLSFSFYSSEELIEEMELSDGQTKLLSEDEIIYLENSLGYKFFD